MELGLSLGDASKPHGFLKESKNPNQKQKPTKMSGLDFCMALGLNSPVAGNYQEPEKAQENDDDDEDDDDADQISQGDGSDDNHMQLNLLPLDPVNPRRQISSHLQSLPWSSDNGSSENGSSGNMGLPASRGLDVNRLPAGEEVSSANSVGSPFGMYGNTAGSGNLKLGGNLKRDYFETMGNDVVEAERTSDDDENGLNTRKKLRLSKEQSAFLEESFKEHHTLNPKQKLALAKQLNLRPRQVEVWFQNRRARTKLKQTEVDCEYLKRCCETLTEENRRLHKELQELRALKTSNPYYMQLPATTLTMCPSCERVATAAPPPTTTSTAAVTVAAKSPAMDSIPKAIPFPLTRPRFYPFSQNPTSHSNQPASSHKLNVMEKN
ncbi:hypothetical protein DH2020_002716 [Rehmannia glutinosa]|uniref:Homeobox domain-containing protein n=1 Tax=Rehmannia glutinosa TaxID=99300 RepID=A0ABR0XV37_REHGL